MSQIQKKRKKTWREIFHPLKNCSNVFTLAPCKNTLPQYLHINKDEVHLQCLTREEIGKVQVIPKLLHSDWLSKHIIFNFMCVNLLYGDLTYSNPISNFVIHNSYVYFCPLVWYTKFFIKHSTLWLSQCSKFDSCLILISFTKPLNHV